MKSQFVKLALIFSVVIGMQVANATSEQDFMCKKGRRLMMLTGVSTNRASVAVTTKGKTPAPKIVRDVVPTRLNVGNYCLNVTRYKQGCYSWEDQDDSRYWGGIWVLRLPNRETAIEKAFMSVAMSSNMTLEGIARSLTIVEVTDNYMYITFGHSRYLVVDNYMIDVRVNMPLSVKRGEEKITAEQLADVVLKSLTSQK